MYRQHSGDFSGSSDKQVWVVYTELNGYAVVVRELPRHEAYLYPERQTQLPWGKVVPI